MTAAEQLRSWYDRVARPLAWRRTADPYAILVSEVMLQQTQAARVQPVWQAFLSRYPTAHALARAQVGEVVKAWAGLGYNRRAINLHRCARILVAEHAGVVPRDLPSLLALPGVGEYTARAVLAFAYDLPVAPVDTNVARVLARAFAGRPLTRREAQTVADDLVPADAPGAWGQAVMELGAQVCTARRPACRSCPVRIHCRWRRSGTSADPAAAGAHRPRAQGRFAGSDRQYRGRIVAALRDRPLSAADVAHLGGPEAARIVGGLVADGLAVRDGHGLRLPG